jgi:hypothetical protein
LNEESDRILKFRHVSEETRFLLKIASNLTFNDSLKRQVAPHILCSYIGLHLKNVELPSPDDKLTSFDEKRIRDLFKAAVSLNEPYDSQSANKILNRGASLIIDTQGFNGLSSLLKNRFKTRNLCASSNALFDLIR